MIRDVYLYGQPGKMFGRHFRLDVSSPAEAVRALMVLRPGLRAAIRQGNWRIIVGAPHIANAIEVHTIGMTLGHLPIHLVPTTRPAGGDSPLGKIAVGVVLIAASVVTAGAAAGFAGGFFAAMSATSFAGISAMNVAVLGASMVLGGVASLIAQPPQAIPGQQASDMATPVEDRPSFMFNGVVNNSTQGGAVPLVFGTHLVGSIVVSAALDASDIAP
jgi:predicted phage tail protein